MRGKWANRFVWGMNLSLTEAFRLLLLSKCIAEIAGVFL